MDDATAAKDAIDAANTNADVATEQGKGETAINAVNPVADAKPKAINRLIKPPMLRRPQSKLTNNFSHREEKDAAIASRRRRASS